MLLWSSWPWISRLYGVSGNDIMALLLYTTLDLGNAYSFAPRGEYTGLGDGEAKFVRSCPWPFGI